MPRLLLVLFLSASLLSAFLPAAPAAAAPPPGEGWQSLREAPVTFHFRPQDQGIARALAETSSAELARISRTTGLPIPVQIDVTLAPSFEEFSAAQPGSPPSWAAGTAYDERAEVYLRSRMPRRGPQTIDRVYSHELVHVLLGRAWVHGEPPRWLNEGLARVLAYEITPEQHLEMMRAALAGRLLPLQAITERWPSGAGRAALAYAQSADFTAWLIERDAELMPRLIARMSTGEPLATALPAVAGADLDSMEKAWRREITFWHALLPVVGGSGFLWGFASLIFGIAAVRKRREVKRKIAAMGSGEPLAPRAVRVSVGSGTPGQPMELVPPAAPRGPDPPVGPSMTHGPPADLASALGVGRIVIPAPPGPAPDDASTPLVAWGPPEDPSEPGGNR